MKVTIEKLPKSALKMTVIVEKEKVRESYEKIVNKAVEETAIEGFRKGKAPKEMVIDKIGVSDLYGDVINDLLKVYYSQAIKENMVSPLSNPKVEVNEFDLDKDFVFTATIATRPDVKIGDFIGKLKESQKLLEETRKKENEEKIKKGEKINDSHVHLSPSEVINIVTNAAEVEVPDLLVEEETERMLSRLLDQAQSIGLSLEQYLKSQNKTADQLREEYSKVAEKNVKSEFVLGQLVKDRNVLVEDSEIENALKAGGFTDVEEKMNNLYEKLYIKSVLQKNKLISDIIEEAEGGHNNEQK